MPMPFSYRLEDRHLRRTALECTYRTQSSVGKVRRGRSHPFAHYSHSRRIVFTAILTLFSHTMGRAANNCTAIGQTAVTSLLKGGFIVLGSWRYTFAVLFANRLGAPPQCPQAFNRQMYTSISLDIYMCLQVDIARLDPVTVGESNGRLG